MKDLRYKREPFLEYGQRFEDERNKIIYRHGFLIECLKEQKMAYYLLKLYRKEMETLP
jgi:hypothetical protein